MTKHTPEPNRCNGVMPKTITVGKDSYVWCYSCGRRSATRPNKAKAIADWNRQTAALALLDACKLLMKGGDCSKGEWEKACTAGFNAIALAN